MYVPLSNSYEDGLVTFESWQAAQGIISNCDALIDLLESIEHFLNRLDIYTRIPATPAMDEIVVKILVELISTLALVTEELKQRRPSESVLTDAFYFCSAPRSQVCKEVFQGEEHRGSAGKARPAHARRGSDYRSSYTRYCPRTGPEYEGVHGW